MATKIYRPCDLIRTSDNRVRQRVGVQPRFGVEFQRIRPPPSQSPPSQSPPSQSASAQTVSNDSRSPAVSSSPAASVDVASTKPAALRPPALKGVTWLPLPTLTRGLTAGYTSHPGSSTWMLWMNPQLLSFRFIPGTKYPEHSPVRAVDNQPATWVPTMVTAFNGAFKLSDHVGGYEYAGHVVVPLKDGLASLVIDHHGALRVLVWGRDSKSATGLLLVRQNLPPLVDHGVSMTRSTDGLRTWGRTIHNTRRANRSALGALPDGSLLYVYGHNVLPSELAAALVHAGVVTAIDLDMNSGWPAALTYRHSGAHLKAARLSPYMHQLLNAYYKRIPKEFIAVLTR